MDGGERVFHSSPTVDGEEAYVRRDAGGGEQQQQQQRQLIRWERFLPRRSLRVLLVEHDDSTRHIVTALLRKCSYHVFAVADGLKAWEILREKQYRFDLVLTEIEMPSLCGISLLSKIMSCELSKNIPVIMMSSHDSVSVVYKCMLKGAVDFLVKPVRRNELRNLWQHVWRKHCSSSHADGAESINNHNMKSGDMSNNNAASNHISANAGSGCKNKERSNDGNDTKSSGSKPELEIQSVERHGESTVLNCSSSMAVELKCEKPHSDKLVLENELQTDSSGAEESKIMETKVNLFSTEKSQEPDCLHDTVSCMGKHLDHKKDGVGELKSLAQNSLPIKPSKQIIDFIGGVADGECRYEVMEKDDKRVEYQLEATDFHVTNGSTTDSLPLWELSLRGPDLNGFSKQDSKARHILKRSAASAFSRYCTGIGFACQKSESSPITLSITMKRHGDVNHNSDTEEKVSSPSARRPASSQGNEAQEPLRHRRSSSRNNDAGGFVGGPSSQRACTTHSSIEHSNQNIALPSYQLGLVSHPFPVTGLPFQSLCPGYGGMMQPVFYSDSFGHGSGSTDVGKVSRSVEFHHYGNQVIYSLPSTVTQQCKEGSHSCQIEGRKDWRDEEHGKCGSLICSDTARSNKDCCGSNGTGEITNAASNAGIGMESGNEISLQDHERKALNQDRSRREAALLKFRLKRKDRCFEKKVRYHNRQKLAEQRPRIKGQFVRQSAIESNTVTIEEDD